MNTPQAKAQIKQTKEIRLQHTQDELNGKGHFWCHRSNYWILPRVCLARQEKGEEGCVKCPQGNVVKQLEEG